MSIWWKTEFRDLINTAPGNHILDKIKYVEIYLAELKKAAEEKSKKEQDQERIHKDLTNLHEKLCKDFNANPYQDKYEVKDSVYTGNTFCYTFENGDKLQLNNDGKLVFETKANKITYQLSAVFRYKFIETANSIQKNARKRPSYKKYTWQDFGFRDSKDNDDFYFDDEFLYEFFKKFGDSSNYSSGSSNNSSRTSSSNNSDNSSAKNSKHPKWTVYQTIVITVTSRREQLSKLSRNHPDRQCLENELKAAITRMEEMQKKYGF
jgi:hypothetical protein